MEWVLQLHSTGGVAAPLLSLEQTDFRYGTPVNHTAAEHIEAPSAAPRSTSSEKSILVVDHEDSVVSSLSKLLSLTFQNYDIQTVPTAIEALEIATSQQLDLIIVDNEPNGCICNQLR